MAMKPQIVSGTSLIRCCFHSLIVLIVLIFMTLAIYNTTRDRKRLLADEFKCNGNSSVVNKNIYRNQLPKLNNGGTTVVSTTTSGELLFTTERISSRDDNPILPTLVLELPKKNKKKKSSTSRRRSLSGCDLFSGKWVYDNKSYPLYKDRECSYMFGDLACETYGRKDLEYQSWRWQPHHCDLPRFNAKELLERLRGKRLVFVGDSVNRNQWVSMVCLLQSVIPKGLKSRRLSSPLYTFNAIEYNATIDFYWAPLLVESNADDSSKHRVADRVVRINSIEKHAKYWSDADILVFNSYLWWRVPKLTVLLGSFESDNKVYKEVKKLKCYKMALKTWSDWLDTNINRTKTRSFFVSMSATHHLGYEWGRSRVQNCLNETEPISKNGFWGSGSDPNMLRIMNDAISNLQRKGLNIQLLNITQLSEYRKDAHPSIYRKQWVPLTKQQLEKPLSYADCTHWCLPGVPDVWNELLYAYIVRSD